MTPGKLNLLVPQGSTYTKVFTWKTGTTVKTPVDLTGMTFQSKAKHVATGAMLVLSEYITITDAVNGQFQIKLPADFTDSLSSTYAYDIEVVDTMGDILRLLEGILVVSVGVTK